VSRFADFGTFAETNRFKQRMLDDGFVATDAMYDDPPTGLLKAKGMREVSNVGKTYSFYGLTPETWKAKVTTGRDYSAEFEDWMKKVLAKAIHCVYLAGHHRDMLMWWAPESAAIDVYMSLENDGVLEFGIHDWNADTRSNAVKLDTTKGLQAECLLAIGSGCNVCTGGNSSHYQSFFKNGAKKPIVLGWDTKIQIPGSNEKSVNNGFFDYLATYAKSNSKVPKSEKLKWFYDNEPMELVRAWGNGCLAYRTDKTKQKRLWTNAHARNFDGEYYKFQFKDGNAEPVKA
jgi:hypothetical protein